MRTTIDIDPDLLSRVVAATGERSKPRAVSKALEEYLRRAKIAEIRIDSWGKIIVDDYSEQALEAEKRKRAYLDTGDDAHDDV
jgi:hypothetical protein